MNALNSTSYFDRLGYIGASSSIEGALACVAGIPYDGTSSYRAGSRFAPDAIRQASVGNLELYDPLLDLDLTDYPYSDIGDLIIENGMDPKALVDLARKGLDPLPANMPLLGLGGEHTVSLPFIEHALKSYPDLGVLTFDAHTDLRDDYADSQYSHACVMRRVHDHIGSDRLAIVGARSGEREEFEFGRRENLLFDATDAGVQAALDKLKGRSLYISFDLDGFDPRELPGTGTPEAGGIMWNDLARWLLWLKDRQFAGADVVELLPSADPSERSTVLAARLARALLLLMLR